jgi:hypothetical protein
MAGNVDRKGPLRISEEMQEFLSKEEARWPKQPDYGASHVKSLRDVQIGGRYRLHFVEKVSDGGVYHQEIRVEELVVTTLPQSNQDFYQSSLLYERSENLKLRGRYSLLVLGLIPGVRILSKIHDPIAREYWTDAHDFHRYTWELNWLEDPLQ